MQRTANTSAPLTGSNATATGTNASAVFEQGRTLIEELTTTQGRAAMTGVLVVVTVLLLLVVAPLLIRQVRRIVTSRLFGGRVAESIELFGAYVPTTFSGIVLRVLQASVLIVAGLSLLIVWGLVDVAVATGQFILDAIPHVLNGALTLLLLVLAYVGSDQLQHAISRFSQGADRVTQHQEEVMLRVGQLVLFVAVGSAILKIGRASCRERV